MSSEKKVPKKHSRTLSGVSLKALASELQGVSLTSMHEALPTFSMRGGLVTFCVGDGLGGAENAPCL